MRVGESNTGMDFCSLVIMSPALADNYKYMPVRGKCSVSLFVNCEICR